MGLAMRHKKYRFMYALSRDGVLIQLLRHEHMVITIYFDMKTVAVLWKDTSYITSKYQPGVYYILHVLTHWG